MSKRTGLFLTLAAFGMLADAQLVVAQQASTINQLGNRAEAGMVTYNKFFQQGQSSGNSSGQLTIQAPLNVSPAQAAFASTAISTPRQDAPGDLTLQSAQTVNSQSGQAPYSSDQAIQNLPSDSNRFSPSVVPPNPTLPAIAPIAAGTSNCDSAVSFYGQRLANSPSSCDSAVNGSALNESAYQQDYRNRRPTNYDSQYSWQNTGKPQTDSIYEQVTNQFNQPHSELLDDCGCDKKRPIYFGSFTSLFGLPYYSDTHSATSITSGGLTRIEPFDYDMVFATRLNAGFETAQGPGGQLSYYNMSANSNLLSVGQPTGATTVVGGLNVPFATPFTVSTPTGGRLDAVAQQDLSSIQVEAFKRIYWPISTLSGGLGLDYTTFDQRVNYSNFLTPTDTVANMTLDGQRRFQGIGPTFSMQYNRPIGHTHLAAIGGIKAGLLFGSDDWAVLSDGARIYETHASRVVSTLNVQLGVEYSKALNQTSNSRLFVRTTIEGQNWLNMGSFASTNSDFGFISGNLAVGLAY